MTKPIAWTIAGSDTGGGAGIQADLKTMNQLGVHACSVITALTAQNTQGVQAIEVPSQGFLTQQLASLSADLPPAAVKLGMLANEAVVATVTQALSQVKAFILYDPVMVSTTGDSLMAADLVSAIRQQLLPTVDLLTPNRTEVEKLLDRPLETPGAIEQAARDLLTLGVKAVLIKGGHPPSQGPTQLAQDYFTDGTRSAWLSTPRLETPHHHGTGCTLSAAITAAVALGFDLLDAIVIAKAYVTQGLRLAPGLGQGHGPLHHGSWPETQGDLPWLTATAEAAVAATARPRFPDVGPAPLGFYPIVNRADWLAKLLPLGVTTAQLRVKDLTGEALEAEVAQAVALAKQSDCRLFINDYWQLALKYGAYGVHLGQSDLDTADLDALAAAGLRLGVSTHCYAEVARGLAVKPSYLAVGPVFHTTTKAMYFAPQGLEAVRRWRRSLPGYPLVAIAGIFLENAREVLDTGVDSLAVVRDIVHADAEGMLAERVAQWLALFPAQPEPALA